MKKVLRLLLAVVAIAVILMIIPEEFHAEKSIVVNGSKAEVAAFVKDFDEYNKWNPWFRIDSTMTSKVEGKVYSWACENPNVGTGTQTLVFESEDSIAHEISFTSPMESSANAYFTFQEVEGGTKVSWGFNSDGNMFAGLIFDPSGNVGDSYTQGLGFLKEEFEKK